MPALEAGIHGFFLLRNIDGRVKSGHDVQGASSALKTAGFPAFFHAPFCCSQMQNLLLFCVTPAIRRALNNPLK